MSTPPSKELYGLSLLRAPGGALVVVKAPLDLSRAETLSPRWVREKKETRPTNVRLPPDKNTGISRTIEGAPILTVVGQEIVHGETVAPALKRLNAECAEMLETAMTNPVAPIELLESLKRTVKPQRKPIQETPAQKRERAERAMGLTGKSDDFVRQTLTSMGRRKSDVEKYIKERHAGGAT